MTDPRIIGTLINIERDLERVAKSLEELVILLNNVASTVPAPRP